MTPCFLNALVAPAFPAYGHITLVASDFHLFALGDDIAVGVDTGVDYGLMAACAGRFYLVDGIGYLEKASRTFEQIGLEIGAQTEANHIAAEIIDDA